MAGKRTYRDPCGIARALDLIGDRWALLVVRELLLGPKRFTELRAGLTHLGPDVLAQRLRELEDTGVVRRRTLPPPAAARVYELTEWGAELEPIVLGLGRWGSQAPFPPGDEPLGADSTMLALKTLFAPELVDGFSGRFEVALGDQSYSAVVADGQLTVKRGTEADPVAKVRTDTVALPAVLWHGRPLEDAIGSGEVEIAGDRAAAERFLGLFPLPVQAPSG